MAVRRQWPDSGRNADAVRTYTRLLQMDPDNASAYESMGVAQLQARDLRAAESSLRKALALDQTLAAAHTALGVVFASTGRRAEAIAAWKRGAALGDANAADNLRAVR